MHNLLVLFTVRNEDLRNVALNKNSYQVSTYTDEFGSHSAKLANDGSGQTSCAVSVRETNPWWVVNLGDPTLVVRVDLTNTGDAAGTDDSIIVYLINFVSQSINIIF